MEDRRVTAGSSLFVVARYTFHFYTLETVAQIYEFGSNVLEAKTYSYAG